jgi:hypothetical protein
MKNRGRRNTTYTFRNQPGSLLRKKNNVISYLVSIFGAYATKIDTVFLNTSQKIPFIRFLRVCAAVAV